MHVDAHFREMPVIIEVPIQKELSANLRALFLPFFYFSSVVLVYQQAVTF